MTDGFRLGDYDYRLPLDQIAQHPAPERVASRLMVVDRRSGRIEHRSFPDLTDYLGHGDCLVLNDSRVFPARLQGVKPTGGKVEFFLLHFPLTCGPGMARARALVRCSKPLHVGQTVRIADFLDVTVSGFPGDGQTDIELHFEGDLLSVLTACGKVPLPPYIRRPQTTADRDRYQTVYARRVGSVAAPTAGLHFTEEQLSRIREKGVTLAWVTLHVGYGTFAPVRKEDIREHRIHAEWVKVPEETVESIRDTRLRGGRVMAVGTTTVRALEAAADARGGIRGFEGLCDLYILPGHRFQVVDRLLTNFHLPRSSLLILVSAFAGRERIISAYQEAVDCGYRFYSYGDAMCIL
jgi:S-adenosylmethionine:tRNA ribosyltransferase-isomerase